MKRLQSLLLLLMVALTRLTAQPVISSQPIDQTVALGGTATFSVTATGTGPFTYQWRFNGTNLPNNIITTVAGDGASNGSFTNNIPATNAILGLVDNLAMDRLDNLFLADSTYLRIRELTTNGILKTVAGTNNSNYPGDGTPATSAGIAAPSGVVVDSLGNFFYSDSGPSHFVVRKVDTNGIVITVAGKLLAAGSSGDGGPATNALLSFPQGLTLDSSENLYIADNGNARVRRVDTNGIITTIAGGGADTNDNIPATSASIAVNGVKFDSKGNLYLFASSVIRKIDTNGIITTLAGKFAHYGFSGDGGPATNAILFVSYGIAFDVNDNLFFADNGNHRIRRIDTNGIITTVVGNGSRGFSGDGGAATDASLNNPYDVAFDSVGNLFIGDQRNNRIRKVYFGGLPSRLVSNVTENNAGTYQVIVTSPSGSITSSVAMLFVPPQIQTSGPVFGLHSNIFGFNVSGSSNQVVVIESSTNLTASQWVQLQTNILTTNTIYFSDPDWTNFSGRYYRVHSP